MCFQWSEMLQLVASSRMVSARPLSLWIVLYPGKEYASVTHVD
jgi:hypothetical protein